MAKTPLQIAIQGRRIGPGQPAYIVAEMSANNGQDFDQAVAIIKAAHSAGADAVKLQTYTADTLMLDCDAPPFQIHGGPWGGRRLYELYQEAYTPWEWQPKLNIRPADAGDARRIWEWANDPAARANSFRPAPIPWEAHLAWYQGRLADPGTRIWILEADGAAVGQIRYERDDRGRAAEISFTVGAAHRGRGYGAALVGLTRDLAVAELGVEELVAISFAENEASRRVFLRAGFATPGVVEIRGRACDRLTWRPAGGRGGRER
jgi:RimJ/RimL family protein N-acetyltransferase